MRKRLKSAVTRVAKQRPMNLFQWRWREAFVAISLLGMIPGVSHALAISNVTLIGTNVTYEQGGVPNGTTVQFTIDSPGQVQISIVGGIQNFGDPGTQVALLTQNYTAGQVGTQSIFWNGLWLINGAQGRIDGLYQFTLTLSTTSGVSTPVVATPLVNLNSVDIHSVSVTPSVDSQGAPTFPYTIGYALAKQSNVSVTITTSSGTLVKTLISSKLQVAETVSTQTVTWDGLQANNQPAPLGVYQVVINATDPAVLNSSAFTSSQTITVGSLAGASEDPKKLFDDSALVYPNPIRAGQAFFKYVDARDGATVTLRIYTITGTLVLDKTLPSAPMGQVQIYPWDVVNQSGNKLGRGLYFYVLRENDPQGVIEITKKLAIIR